MVVVHGVEASTWENMLIKGCCGVLGLASPDSQVTMGREREEEGEN